MVMDTERQELERNLLLDSTSIASKASIYWFLFINN